MRGLLAGLMLATLLGGLGLSSRLHASHDFCASTADPTMCRAER